MLNGANSTNTSYFLNNNNLAKKRKIDEVEEKEQTEGTESTTTQIEPNVRQSPKKRLNIEPDSDSSPNNKKSTDWKKFIYGNYSNYYKYRNKESKDLHDIRLDVFDQYESLFREKDVLDIGCNSGHITLEIARRFQIKSIIGIDIDRNLCQYANNALSKEKKLTSETTNTNRNSFPLNVRFIHGNYVLKDDVLLEIERERFDIILCLSVTKWIHLNFGDDGLKQAFKRMFKQLRSGGKLILEAQPFKNYGRRKHMTETINSNYNAIKFFPDAFTEFLLSSEVGFKSVDLMGIPDHCKKGFKRPIQIFSK